MFTTVLYVLIVLVSTQNFFVDANRNVCGKGVSVRHGVTPLANNSFVDIKDIGKMQNGSSIVCTTALRPCCLYPHRLGEWYYPNGTVVPGLAAGWEYYRGRSSDGEVHLSRRNTTLTPLGNFYCKIPDLTGTNQTLIIQVYQSDHNSTSAVITSVTFNQLSPSIITSPAFVFTCTAIGPIHTFSWLKDGIVLNNTGPVVVDKETPTYHNDLVVIGRHPGTYTCLIKDRNGYILHDKNYEDDGIVIRLGDREIPNHGLVAVDDIGVDPNVINLGVGLSCSTTYDMCCSDYDTSHSRAASGVGSWLYAHYNEYVLGDRSKIYNFIFRIKRNGSAVYLLRNYDSTNVAFANGIWRCVIPDSNGVERTKYIGIYTFGSNHGVLTSAPGSRTIWFSVVNETQVVFNLTLNTTGGPATYVTWTKDGVDILSLKDTRYIMSQTVIDNRGNYTAGDYVNTLTVQGRLPGLYGVSVTNDRTTYAVTSSTIVSNVDFTVSRSQDYRRITLSWNSVSHPLLSYLVAYEVQYIKCFADDECEAVESVNITQQNHYTLSSVTLWVTYNFTVISHFNYSPSVFTLPKESITIETLGVIAPILTSVLELENNITSAKVTWDQPTGGLAADQCVVYYRRINGREEQCSSFQDEGSVMVGPETEAVPYTAILHLKAYSIYVVNVTCKKGALYNTSNSLQFETNSTVPSGAPQNLHIISNTSSSSTLSWNSVDCIHRNGLIIHYIVTTESPSGQIMIQTVMPNDQDGGGSLTVYGLNHEPPGRYTFMVAAINSIGLGPFSSVQTGG